jgi:hypothetical protein
MNQSDDEKLSAFIKMNAPEAPARKPDELARLMRKLDLEDEPVVFQKKTWFAFAGAIAAGVMAFIVAIQKAPQPQYVASLTAEIIEIEEELPSLEIGEDYLSLATATE